MKKAILIIAALLLECRAPAEIADGTGLQVSAAVDLVGTFGGQTGNTVANRLEAREAELSLFSPIDHLFDGLVSLAAHQENGIAFFEIHEAAISSSRLIPRSRFRLGQFFLGIGRLNQVHRHDWPFVSAPKVHTEFLNNEGVIDTGFEYSYLAPVPFYLDLTFGITNGWVFGHAHNIGRKPLFPTHYARAATYLPLLGGGVQLGLNYVGRRASNGVSTTLLGLDTVAKWREGQQLTYLFQSEIWYRARTVAGADAEKTLGMYFYPQCALSPQLSLGVRLDFYSVLNLKDAVGENVTNIDYGLVPTLTYKASEFSTIRVSYDYLGSYRSGRQVGAQKIFEIQATFILGTHPAHDF